MLRSIVFLFVRYFIEQKMVKTFKTIKTENDN